MSVMTDKAFIEAVQYVVEQVPLGKVATYGQIARLVGYPNHARHVGKALANLSNDSEVPWHRIVNSKGEVSARSQWSANAGREIEQRYMLEYEGIEFGPHGRIYLKIFLWED